MDDFSKFDLDGIVLTKNSNQYDLSTRAMNMTIAESMTSPYISGSLEILDFTDEIGRLDIDGTEKIAMGFKSTDKDEFLTFDLRISKVGISAANDLKKRTLIFQLVSPEFLAGATTTVGTGFVNERVSEIAKKVIGENLDTDKLLSCHDTDKKMDIVIPQLNVWETMEMLCDCAYNDTSHQTSLFHFGETRDGYHFVNVEELIDDLHNEDAVWPEFLYRSDVRLDLPGSDRKDILNQSFNKSNDFRERIHSSIHRADTKTISILDRTYRKAEFDSRKFVEGRFTSTENELPGLPDTDGLLDLYATKPTRVYSLFSSRDWSVNGLGAPIHTYSPKRLFYQRLLAHSAMGIEVIGNSDMKPRTFVEIVLPRMQIHEYEDEELYIPGRYLVSGVSHNIDIVENVYTQTLALMRDSLLDNQDRTEIEGSRKRIRSRQS